MAAKSIAVRGATWAGATSCLLVACTPATRGEVRLKWPPPEERTDGTPLERVEAYRIAWGRHAGGPYDAGSRTIDAAAAGGGGSGDPQLASATVRDLEPGRWCFVVYAIDEQGSESEASPEACRAVDGREDHE